MAKLKIINPKVHHVTLKPDSVFAHPITLGKPAHYVQIENLCQEPVAVRFNGDSEAILWINPDVAQCFWQDNFTITSLDFSVPPNHQGGRVQVLVGVSNG